LACYNKSSLSATDEVKVAIASLCYLISWLSAIIYVNLITSEGFVTYGLIGSVFFIIGSLIVGNLIKDFLD